MMSWEEKSKGVISERLRTLMMFAKRPDTVEWTWQAVAEALKGLYSDDMKLVWVMHHLVAAYEEALAEPRFQLGRGNTMLDVLLSPVRGHTSIQLLGPGSLQTPYTVEQFYNAMVHKILGELQITNVGWLRDLKQAA